MQTKPAGSCARGETGWQLSWQKILGSWSCFSRNGVGAGRGEGGVGEGCGKSLDQGRGRERVGTWVWPKGPICAQALAPEAQVVSLGETQGVRRPQAIGTGELIPATASCPFLRAPWRRPPCPSCPRSTALWSAYPQIREAGFSRPVVLEVHDSCLGSLLQIQLRRSGSARGPGTCISNGRSMGS